VLLLLIAFLIGAASFFYISWLAQKMSEKERKSIAIWAEATRTLSHPATGSSDNMYFLLQVIEANTDIPIILTDSTREIISSSNISYPEKRKEQVLQRQLKKMIREHPPIQIHVSEKEKQYLYYRDSAILQKLKYFPVAQITIITLFILISYLAFSESRQAEQNSVWAGMSKETAHQLGTPVSSLMAWAELLKMQKTDPALLLELDKDINHLNKIVERFSKIGSTPELITADLKTVILSTVAYLEKRTSSKINFIVDLDKNRSYLAPHNPALLGWVIENLCKNAVNAIEEQGTITLHLYAGNNQFILDVTDTGRGIPKSQFKTIFRPGFTTRKRGWGLGLSLSKRMIENYHKGKIFLKQSEPGKGSTFRIILRTS